MLYKGFAGKNINAITCPRDDKILNIKISINLSKIQLKCEREKNKYVKKYTNEKVEGWVIIIIIY